MKRDWLIKFRKDKDMSQLELANLCDVTQMMISNIENGIRRPSPRLAKKIANIFNFSWTIFYDDELKKDI